MYIIPKMFPLRQRRSGAAHGFAERIFRMALPSLC
jgi:hypothetical protein